jgi:hypothetical protein
MRFLVYVMFLGGVSMITYQKDMIPSIGACLCLCAVIEGCVLMFRSIK